MSHSAITSLRLPWLKLARLVWLSYAVFTLGAYFWLIPYRLNESEVPGWSDWTEAERVRALADLGISRSGLTAVENVLNLSVPVLFFSLALILFWKRSSDPGGFLWACFFIVFWAPFSYLGEIYPAWQPVGNLSDSLGSVLTFIALYTFPDGRFRPRWTLWLALVMAAIQVWRLFQPELYGKVFPLMGIGFFISIPLAQVYRYARLSDATQRRQIKWVVFGLAVCAVPLAIFLLVLVLTPALQQPTTAGMAAFLVGNFIWTSFAFVLPLSLMIAIFRSGLWDIDLLIRKTLVYSLLTGLLSLVYFGGVALLQGLLSDAEAQSSPVIIVLTTLLIAALFNPLRRRLQDFIDRRFYRQKYDAEKALAGFAAEARSETDLAQLTEHLTGTVQDTLQPVQLTLWLIPHHQINRDDQ